MRPQEVPSIQNLYNVISDDKHNPESTAENQLDFGSGSTRNTQLRTRDATSTPLNERDWIQGDVETSAILAMLCPNEYQEQLLANFIHSLSTPVTLNTFKSHGVWLAEVAEQGIRSASLQWSIRALVISHLGRQACDAALIQNSRTVYGKALQRLNRDLQDREQALSSDDTLSACMLLTFYEVYNCTDSNSWLSHAGGAGNLIRLRGPDRHRSGHGKSVFLAFRYFLVMEAFHYRKACFLNTPEWRKLCWDIYETSPKGPFYRANEEYFQEFVATPNYVVRALRVVSAKDPSTDDLQAALRKGQGHRERFKAIKSRMDAQFPKLGLAPNLVPSAHKDELFPEIWQYPDVHVASIFTGYCAMMCLLNVSLMGLEAKIKRLYTEAHHAPVGVADIVEHYVLQDGTVIRPPRAPRPLWDAAAQVDEHPYRAESIDLARDVCKSSEWMSNQPFLAPLFLLLSLRLTLRILPLQVERQWVIDMLLRISAKMQLAKSVIEDFESFSPDAELPAGIALVTEVEKARAERDVKDTHTHHSRSRSIPSRLKDANPRSEAA
ncbi:uncharacterized protein KY384_006473 [Bacidia gigantensis]|uniref:uncharacterized protein n=1 Tax=Bacidia gigantensis TaxID=2732470 RepID=UPI001D05016F|nr:uncharacterized protein KY384_006473 [Bacidia gigantensis]KAG8528785.1 hypothetical protein KY384_006473 [Bacidia gigantensis]